MEEPTTLEEMRSYYKEVLFVMGRQVNFYRIVLSTLEQTADIEEKKNILHFHELTSAEDAAPISQRARYTLKHILRRNKEEHSE